LEGGRVLYMSGDGQYLMQGYLYQMRDGGMVNLTEQAESAAVARQLNALPRNEMVIFAPKNPRTHITVFTDTDCGYCQLLHKEVPELNRQGVEVRYVAYPRAGVGSSTYKDLVSVWCAKDQQEAMNQAKARKKIPAATCDNPVEAQYKLGQMIGVQGTPAIFLANGQLIPGYQPADKLAPAALQARWRRACTAPHGTFRKPGGRPQPRYRPGRASTIAAEAACMCVPVRGWCFFGTAGRACPPRPHQVEEGMPCDCRGPVIAARCASASRRTSPIPSCAATAPSAARRPVVAATPSTWAPITPA